jgi:hypothetical protein
MTYVTLKKNKSRSAMSELDLDLVRMNVYTIGQFLKDLSSGNAK